MTLLLDEVTRARLGDSALNVSEALRCLRRGADSLDLTAVMGMLRDATVAVQDVMHELRDAAKVQEERRPSLPAARVESRLGRLTLLREWFTADRPYIAGLSFHQAKGREWAHVDVALDASGRGVVATGLDGANEEHRKLYVALTRGSHGTRLRAI
jgi:DNA helicase II / ATP-dependent DNA helicase PcrA